MYAISTKQAPQPKGAFSQGTSAGRLVCVSAQEALDPISGELIKGSVALKTLRCLRNVDAILEAAGLGLHDISKMTVYLTNLSDLSQVDAVIAEKIQRPYPACTPVEVRALPKGGTIAIEALAIK